MALDGVSGSIYNDPVSRLSVTNKATDLSVQEIVEGTGAAGRSASFRTTGKPVGNIEQENDQKNNAATEQQIKKAINKANDNLKHTRCEFSYHEETNRVSIKVYDTETEEVIREIPPEEALDMIEKMWELAGLLFDEKR